MSFIFCLLYWITIPHYWVLFLLKACPRKEYEILFKWVCFTFVLEIVISNKENNEKERTWKTLVEVITRLPCCITRTNFHILVKFYVQLDKSTWEIIVNLQIIWSSVDFSLIHCIYLKMDTSSGWRGNLWYIYIYIYHIYLDGKLDIPLT